MKVLCIRDWGGRLEPTLWSVRTIGDGPSPFGLAQLVMGKRVYVDDSGRLSPGHVFSSVRIER